MSLQFPIQNTITLDTLLTHYNTHVAFGGYDNIKDDLRDTVFAGIPNVGVLKNNTEDQLRAMIDQVTVASGIAPNETEASLRTWRTAAHTFINWCTNPNGGGITFLLPPAPVPPPAAPAPAHANSSSHSQSRLRNWTQEAVFLDHEAIGEGGESNIGARRPIGLIPLVCGSVRSLSQSIIQGWTATNPARSNSRNSQDSMDIHDVIHGHCDFEGTSLELTKEIDVSQQNFRRRVVRTPEKRKLYIELPSDDEEFSMK
uniref:Uncharacterized protein n=1 Tax=Percolomonas cosmopolitus TaxID=63605 RepID=A0A7S1KSR1_9EUKA|mmetsp:Transcript_6881/g.25700  ORF Transcript_6881/g.25700 Transcript_6881/m.25700 type:complete len:257 (+) Transcript_6881:141-911(+)